MDNTTLITVASVGLRISLVLLIIGAVLTVLLFWRFDIRNIYLIRSGKAKRKTVSKMQEHNNRTGKLREEFDLDYSTGKLRREGRKSGRTESAQDENTPFVRADHSGDTGSFSDQNQIEMPEAQQAAVRESERRAESKETDVLTSTEGTTLLDAYPPDQYASRIGEAYNDTPDDEEGGEVTQTLYEPRVQIDIISKELIIHTNEIIEI